jgi:glycosyltransferase involved in cell wall biosynthesis
VKVVWISHRGELGGAELSLLEGARGLVRRGVEVEAVLPWNGRLAQRLDAAGVQVTLIPHARWVGRERRPADVARRLAQNARALRPLMRALESSGADVVVTNTVTAPLGAVAARLKRVPHVWFLHEFGLEDHGVHFDLGRRASLRAIRLSDAVLVNSEAMRSYFAPLLGIEPRVAHYAVEVPDREAQLPVDRPFTLVQVATLSAGKGQLDAVGALALLARRGRDVRLRLVGGGADAFVDLVRAEARRQHVDDRIEFVGFTDDPTESVLASHVALTCSRMEAFGRATVEAMKLGRPVVGAASGGTLELVRDGWSGLLYTPGDAAALAERIERLDRDRAFLRELAANARSWATATFTTERFTDSLMAVFDEVSRRRALDGPDRPRR